MKNKIVRGARNSDGPGNTVIDPTNGIRAMQELKRFKSPKPMSFGHKQNVAKFEAKGMLKQQYRFALIDYRNGNEVIKTSVMDHGEAWKKNKALEGTGIAWAKIDGR